MNPSVIHSNGASSTGAANEPAASATLPSQNAASSDSNNNSNNNSNGTNRTSGGSDPRGFSSPFSSTVRIFLFRFSVVVRQSAGLRKREVGRRPDGRILARLAVRTFFVVERTRLPSSMSVFIYIVSCRILAIYLCVFVRSVEMSKATGKSGFSKTAETPEECHVAPCRWENGILDWWKHMHRPECAVYMQMTDSFVFTEY